MNLVCFFVERDDPLLPLFQPTDKKTGERCGLDFTSERQLWNVIVLIDFSPTWLNYNLPRRIVRAKRCDESMFYSAL
jgi:hypothetical protein